VALEFPGLGAGDEQILVTALGEGADPPDGPGQGVEVLLERVLDLVVQLVRPLCFVRVVQERLHQQIRVPADLAVDPSRGTS
jgi:hypothetical protein